MMERSAHTERSVEGCLNPQLFEISDHYRRYLRGKAIETRSSNNFRRFREIVNSVQHRAHSLGFHVWLLEEWHQLYEGSIRSTDLPDSDRSLLRRGVNQSQFFFDDLIFNTASLFDYLGCLCVHVFVGIDKSDTTWRKVIGKLNSSIDFTPENTIDVYRRIDSGLVDALIKYRSRVIHYRFDEVNGSISQDLKGTSTTLRIDLPTLFTEHGILDSETLSLHEAGSVINDKCLKAADEFTTAIAKDLPLKPFPEPVETHQELVNRWLLWGLLDKLSTHPELSSRGIDRVAGSLSAAGFTPTIIMEDGASIEGPILQPDQLMSQDREGLPIGYFVSQIANFLEETRINGE